MVRVWVFRLILILAPFAGLVVVAVGLEAGARIYFSFKNVTPWPAEVPKPLPVKTARSTASIFAFPTEIAKKAVFQGAPFRFRSDLIDKSLGYPTHTFIKNVYSKLPSAKETLVWRLISNNEVFHDYSVETDHLGRRITPDSQDGRGRFKKTSGHLVFFGCSNTFGEGVEQNETIPYYAAAATKKYRSYNLGVSGSSIAEAWAYTHILDLLEDIPEKKGYAFYIFLDTHVSRYKGSLVNLAGWIERRPFVRPDENGHIQFFGRFNQVHPWYTKLSYWTKKSYFLNSIHFNFPPLQEQDFKDYVKVVASVRDAYESKFGKENPFVFVFYFQYAREYAPILKPLLEQQKIRYLDYSSYELEKLSDQPMHIPFDGHPNALAHKLVGELIAADLKLQ